MTRRFVRHRHVPEELLENLLDLARRAPSAGFSQGTTFLVLEGVALARFWELTGAGNWFAEKSPGVLDAPTIVIPLGDERAYTLRYHEADKGGHGLDETSGWPVPYWLTDTAMAAQQLLLLAEDAGLGALFFGIFRNGDELLAEFGVPDGVTAIGAIALGYRCPDDRPSGTPKTRPRRPRASVVMRNGWTRAPASD